MQTFHWLGYIMMHSDQNQIGTELIVALGQLGQAQELGADCSRLICWEQFHDFIHSYVA